jgi:hypothetical protein
VTFLQQLTKNRLTLKDLPRNKARHITRVIAIMRTQEFAVDGTHRPRNSRKFLHKLARFHLKPMSISGLDCREKSTCVPKQSAAAV